MSITSTVVILPGRVGGEGVCDYFVLVCGALSTLGIAFLVRHNLTGVLCLFKASGRSIGVAAFWGRGRTGISIAVATAAVRRSAHQLVQATAHVSSIFENHSLRPVWNFRASSPG